MKYLKSYLTTARVDSFLLHSDAWKYLPKAARDILEKHGYTADKFRASVVPIGEGHKSRAVFTVKNNISTKYIYLSDLKDIDDIKDSGRISVGLSNGRLQLQYDLEDYYEVKEQER